MAVRIYDIPYQTIEEVSFWANCPIQILRGYQEEEVSQLSHFDWLIPFFSEKIGRLYVETNGKVYSMGRLDRCVSAIVGMSIKWVDYVKRFLMPGGQLKNFLVGVRTAVMARDVEGEISILSRGSKSESASGNWIHYLALFLSSLGMKGKIDCYDIGEVSSIAYVRGFQINHCARYYDGDGHEYTVVIDDASIRRDVVGGDFKSKYFSLKGQGPHFLHETEGRLFSHQITGIDVKCGCPVCVKVSECVRTFGEWQTLKRMTVLFGGAGCDLIDHITELRAKGNLFQQLHMNPTVDVQLPLDVRSVLSLRDEFPLRVVDNHTIQKSLDSQRIEYVHKKGFDGEVSLKNCSELKGKNVFFCGVDPRVLGRTPILTGHVGEVHAFVYDYVALMATSVRAPEFVWIPRSDIPGYTLTGQKWDTFFQHQRNKVQERYDEEVHYFSELGLDVGEGDVEWTKYVPGNYRVSVAQAKQLNIMPISYHFGYSPFLFSFKDVNGKECQIDPKFPFLFDCDERHYVYSSKMRDGAWHVIEDHFGVVVIRKCGEGECDGQKKCGHDHLIRRGGKQKIIREILQSYPVSENFFNYTVRQKLMDDMSFARCFSARRGLLITKGDDGVWIVGGKIL